MSDLRWKLALLVIAAIVLEACNPFAPAFDDSDPTGDSVLGDTRTVEGIFQNVKVAYTFRDTTIYGQLIHSDFSFVYRDYDRGVDVSWGRDEEMRITHQLFRNVQRLDLVWNNVISISTDSANTRANVSRNFNLTVTFNPTDIIRVDGYATLNLIRPRSDAPWLIERWRDESNF